MLHYQRGQGGLLSQISLDDHVLTQHIYQNGMESRQTCTRDYGYDALGNLSQISDSQHGERYFDYDPLSRLKAVRGNLEEQFVHDATGNVLSQHLGRQQEALNLAQASGNKLAFHGDSHYEYDEFGRLTTENRGKDQSLITTYEYDCQHRLIKAQMPDGTTADYTYDAFGRRTAKTVTDKTGQSTTTEFMWQGDNLIGEVTGKDYQTYVYEPGTFKPLALVTGEGKDNADVYYYHLDQIGTPIDITDAQGQSVWSVQYRAYGNVLTQHVEEIESSLRFQGQYYDAETGLHYNRHRYYSPSSGRFTTVDPIGLAGGLNNYQYVPNPIGWVDPLGLESILGDECISIYRGDDNYRGGDVGSPESSISAEDIIKHVRGDSTDGPLVSFSTQLSKGSVNSRGAKFFGDKTISTNISEVNGSVITPDDAFNILKSHPKKKIRIQAGNIKANMQRNNEVLINGTILSSKIKRTG